MKKQIWIIIILAIIIIILASVLLFFEKSSKDVEIYNLTENQETTSPLIIEGRAKGTYFFEASFPVKIIDEAGNVLGTSYAKAQSDWMTEDYVDFTVNLSFATKAEGKGYLIFAKDNPSGLPEYDKETRFPIILKPTGMMNVKVYFNNNRLDPEVSCNKVFQVEREITKIEAVGSAAIQELLKGPTSSEQANGFFTNINQGVKMQSLAIKDGIAYVDFDEQLESGVGGSCRVSAIRAQITETLKQFPTIDGVVISINGRTEDILQP
jgi:hypothetical protein